MKNLLTQCKTKEKNPKIGGNVPLIDKKYSGNVLLIDGEHSGNMLFIDSKHSGNILLIDRNSQNWKMMLNVYLSKSSQNW